MFYDPVKYAGLSTTNGNLARSSNARPYPMLRFSTSGYKSLHFIGDWLQFKAEYDEGLLNDERMVDNARLHHKSFYLGINAGNGWRINMGLEHFVMWGGTSRIDSIGKQPSGIDTYWRYVLGKQGNETFVAWDQENIAGNQFGTYQLEVKKQFEQVNSNFLPEPSFRRFIGDELAQLAGQPAGVAFTF